MLALFECSFPSRPSPYKTLNVWGLIQIVYKLLSDPLKHELGNTHAKKEVK